MKSEPDRESVELAEHWVDHGFSEDVDFPPDENWDIRWYRLDVEDATLRALNDHPEGIWYVAKRHDKDAAARRKAMSEGKHFLADLVRDIFGNPFRPINLDSSWLTSDVLSLARGIYDERAFDRMSILADALQDAGCTNEDILSHCRDANQIHVRGCWVVDLLLGKT